MFENAIESVHRFTRPLQAISRNVENDKITQESTTIFFVNEFGVAVTTAEVIHRFFQGEPAENLKTMFLNCAEGSCSVQALLHPTFNVGVIHLQNDQKYTYE